MGLLIKKCLSCGATVEVLHDCTCKNCGIQCCGKPMVTIKPNTADAAIEKHLPIVEVMDNYIMVTVPHVMESDHYIEWIALAGKKVIGKKFFTPGEEAKAIFPYKKGTKVYSYCNKHGLWEIDVK